MVCITWLFSSDFSMNIIECSEIDYFSFHSCDNRLFVLINSFLLFLFLQSILSFSYYLKIKLNFFHIFFGLIVWCINYSTDGWNTHHLVLVVVFTLALLILVKYMIFIVIQNTKHTGKSQS